MSALLDTAVLIGANAPANVEAAISVASLTDLNFGVLVAAANDERARRVGGLAANEAAFDPLPISVEVARMWPARCGGRATRRQPSASADRPRYCGNRRDREGPLLTRDLADFEDIQDLVEARQP